MSQPSLFGGEPVPATPLPPAKMPWDAPAAPLSVLRSRARSCSDCGARIFFALVSKKVKGREVTGPMPIDVEYDLKGTVHIWVESGGRVLRGHVFGRAADRKGRQTLHMSHMFTCPFRDKYRQRSDH